MSHFPPDCAEHSHAQDLQLILCTTLSLLQEHLQFITHTGRVSALPRFTWHASGAARARSAVGA
jgi:hypothetical protein